MAKLLEGRRILVTGAASGIGRAVARMFAQEGARLAVLDRQAAALGLVAEDACATSLTVDLAQTDLLPAIVERAATAMGGLDGVVNAAGIGHFAPIRELSHADWALSIAINLTAPYAICRAAAPHLRAALGSTVVNIASGAALLPDNPNATAYAASKGGLISFTKALASELAPIVRVNSVCPGLTDTPMVARLSAGANTLSSSPAAQRYALKRPAQPEEIAAAILFLTGPASSFVTGSTLVVDGGRIFH